MKFKAPKAKRKANKHHARRLSKKRKLTLSRKK
jgi:hypothetical protein